MCANGSLDGPVSIRYPVDVCDLASRTWLANCSNVYRIAHKEATLYGDVHSWPERQAVLGAVKGTRGVEDVLDRMRIA